MTGGKVKNKLMCYLNEKMMTKEQREGGKREKMTSTEGKGHEHEKKVYVECISGNEE